MQLMFRGIVQPGAEQRDFGIQSFCNIEVPTYLGSISLVS